MSVEPASPQKYAEFAGDANVKYVPELIQISLFDLSTAEPRLITMTYGGANSQQAYGPEGGAAVVAAIGQPGIKLFFNKSTCVPADASAVLRQ